MNHMTKIVNGMLAFLIAFTVAVLWIVAHDHPEPSTLIAMVFGFCSVEGGLMAWIKNTNTKHKKGEKKNEI
jgi:hypothetical protein